MDRLRIVTLEEHAIDPGLAEFAAGWMARHAPYQGGIGSRYRETPPPDDAGLPRMTGMARARELGAAPIADRLAAMDRHGIDCQVLSSTAPAQAAPPELVRAANDRLAAIAAAHPGRFSGLASLPWQDPQAAVAEADRAAGELGLTGAMLAGHPGEDALVDDPRFDPVLARLAALDLPLYIHPGPPLRAVQSAYYAGFDPEISGRLSLFGWGWHNEAGVQVVRLILSGAFERHPNLKVISGHWGEMVPFWLHRLDDALPPAATGLQRSIGETYRAQVWVTPSGMLYDPHARFCQDVLGADRLLFAVDYPYLSLTGARGWIEGLPMDDADRAAFAHGNAEALLRV